jgi:hypothetical protein
VTARRLATDQRTGHWIDQGDGTSLRYQSAIADGYTADVLSTGLFLKGAAERHADTTRFLAAANSALDRGLCAEYVARTRPQDRHTPGGQS